MKRSLRIVSLLLLLAMLLPACAQSKTNDPAATTPAVTADTTAAPVEETTTEDPNDRSKVEDNVPDDVRFDGTTLHVLYRGNADGKGLIETLDVVGTDNIGDYVSDGVWERNRKVEERLGITFDFIAGMAPDLGSMATMVRSTVVSGSDEYDYINSTGNTNITQSLNIYMRDLANLPYVDYSEPWWWPDVICALSLDGKTYNYIFGDMCVYCYIQTGVFYYNKAMYEDVFGDPDEMYSFVMNGTWTVDMLMEKAQTAYKDANGNGVQDTGDVFGVLKTANQGEETDHYIQACGVEMYHYDENNHLVIEFDQERAVLAVEKLGALYNTTPGVFHSDLGIDQSDKYFADGTVLFFPARFSRVTQENLRSMEQPYGILPYPKLTEDQKEYYSLIHDSSSNICVPKSVGEDKMPVLGATFEALCAESWRSVMPLFLETALKLKYSQDSMSGQVIDIVIDSVAKNTLIEYRNYANDFINNCMGTNIKNGKNNFASVYKKALSAAQKAWDKAVEKIGG